uniref:Uncharacterized protein n=1 Tax=Salix viminalis TaxID=40686 RepID=A0A6N2LTF4_SALVM
MRKCNGVVVVTCVLGVVEEEETCICKRE